MKEHNAVWWEGNGVSCLPHTLSREGKPTFLTNGVSNRPAAKWVYAQSGYHIAMLMLMVL